MSKKGRIISWVIIALLAVAVVAVIVTQLLNGGAVKITRTQFQEYVENAQYVNSDGTAKDVGDIPEGYHIGDGGKVVDEKGNPIVVIWRIETNGYEYSGYDSAVKGTKRYYCYGPSAYGSESWDSETLYKWQFEYGVVIDQANPNAGSWVSTAFSVLMLVVVCVVFFLIIRSSMGGAGKVMSFAKTKARISTNIKVRFTDVAGAEEEKVELAEIVEFLRQPKKFSDLGARTPSPT